MSVFWGNKNLKHAEIGGVVIRAIALILLAVVLVFVLLIESNKIKLPSSLSTINKPEIIKPAKVAIEELKQRPKEEQSKDVYKEQTEIQENTQVRTRAETETPELFVPDIIPSLVNGQKTAESKTDRLILGALAQYGVTNSYNGAYQKIPYPNGDVDPATGVCTDVIIRAFRSINIDLQKEVHQDMQRHFREYPRQWGLKHPDTNIDHRRVPNLETYLTRKGYRIPVSKNTDTEHYRPGDLVVWRISGKLTHIGIVSDVIVPNTSRYFIIHNPVQGVEISDWLNEFEIINHFRLFDE